MKLQPISEAVSGGHRYLS